MSYLLRSRHAQNDNLLDGSDKKSLEKDFKVKRKFGEAVHRNEIPPAKFHQENSKRKSSIQHEDQMSINPTKTVLRKLNPVSPVV
jgi:hypothetical protein